jgi:hypothetical protein
MFDSSHNGSPNLRPIDALVQFFIDQAHNGDIVSPDQIQAMRDLARWLRIIWRTDDPLDCLR